MGHKTCCVSCVRHTLESAVKNGERLMWMTDERLRSMIRCPRCRASLPFQRSLSIENHYLVIQYEWTDKTPIAQATHQYLGDDHISTEQAAKFGGRVPFDFDSTKTQPPFNRSTPMARSKTTKKTKRRVRFAVASIKFAERPRKAWRGRARARTEVVVSVAKFDDIVRSRDLATLFSSVCVD